MVVPVLIVTSDTKFGTKLFKLLDETNEYVPSVVWEGKRALERSRRIQFSIAVIDVGMIDGSATDLGQALQEISPEIQIVFIYSERSSDIPLVIPQNSYQHIAEICNLLEVLHEIQSFNQPLDNRQTNQPSFPYEGSLPEGDGLRDTPQTGDLFSWEIDRKKAATQLEALLPGISAHSIILVREGMPWAFVGKVSSKVVDELVNNLNQHWMPNGGKRYQAAQNDSLQRNDQTLVVENLARYVRLEAGEGACMLYASTLKDGFELALVFDPDVPLSTIRRQTGALGRELLSVVDNNVQPEMEKPSREQEEGIYHQYTDKPTPRDEEGRKAPCGEDLELSFEAENVYQNQAQNILCQLQLTCVLIPRLPWHRLDGEVENKLSGWMKQISLVYGFRLKNLVINPDYLMWLVNLPPDLSVNELVGVVRLRLSEWIFNEFPRYSRENPSGDFWAPGYMVVNGDLPVRQGRIEAYLRQTRDQQGAKGL